MNIDIQIKSLFLFYFLGFVLSFLYEIFKILNINFKLLYIIIPFLFIIFLIICFFVNGGIIHIYFLGLLFISILVNTCLFDKVYKLLKKHIN